MRPVRAAPNGAALFFLRERTLLRKKQDCPDGRKSLPAEQSAPPFAGKRRKRPFRTANGRFGNALLQTACKNMSAQRTGRAPPFAGESEYVFRRTSLRRCLFLFCRKNFSITFLLTVPAFLYKKRLFTPCGSNSVVECNLAKVEVAGSNPVSRSNDISGPVA